MILKETFLLPLIIFRTFFAFVFMCEALWFTCAAEEKRIALRRYQAVEHPHRKTSDQYLDLLG